MIFSMGYGFGSDLLVNQVAATERTILLIALILVAAWTTGPGWRLGLLPLTWFVFWLFKQAINALSATGLETLDWQFYVLAFKGIVLVVFIVLIWLPKPRIFTAKLTVVPATMFVLAAGLYGLNYNSAVLHFIGATYSSSDRVDMVIKANTYYEAAEDFALARGRVHLDHAYNLSRLSGVTEALIRHRLEPLFKAQPFVNHMREWQVFEREYARLRGAHWD